MVHEKRKRNNSDSVPSRPKHSSTVYDGAYEHLPLPTKTSIRILELQPGEGTTTLRCKLSAIERDDAPPYEAISYSWGRSIDTRVIYCEGKKLKVTVNLRDALWRIRDSSDVKLLWADAVCINQFDNEERANQVKLMAKIYANAVRVLVWLDVPNAKFGDFDYLFDVGINNSGNHAGSSAGRASVLLEEYVAKLEQADLHSEELNPDFNMVGHALTHLLDSPWFTRLWVVQEVGLAKSVVAMFGDTTIDFVDLIRLILRLECRTLLIDRLGLVTAAKANIFTTFPARSMELDGEVDQDWDFLELMEVTRSQRASDPRDYVYALLGHPSALINGIPIIEPSYTIQLPDLLLDIAVKLIRATNSLRVLSAVQHTEETQLRLNTPLWVPTWTRDTIVTSLGALRDHYYDVSYDASIGFDPVWEFEKDSIVLKVQGFVLDTVEEYCTTIETESQEDDQVGRSLNMGSLQWQATKNGMTTGTAAQKSIDQVLIDATRFKSGPPLSLIENFHEIGMVITAGYSNDKPSNFGPAFAALRLHLVKEAYNQGRFIPIEMAPEGRAELRSAAKGADIDGIYWAASRFCAGRNLFSTSKGLLGLGPAMVERGDLCCILFGAPVPFILRRDGDQYRIVGEAYIGGIMKGEAMVDLMLGNQYQTETFDLK